jgi:hypothetical protein
MLLFARERKAVSEAFQDALGVIIHSKVHLPKMLSKGACRPDFHRSAERILKPCRTALSYSSNLTRQYDAGTTPV